MELILYYLIKCVCVSIVSNLLYIRIDPLTGNSAVKKTIISTLSKRLQYNAGPWNISSICGKERNITRYADQGRPVQRITVRRCMGVYQTCVRPTSIHTYLFPSVPHILKLQNR